MQTIHQLNPTMPVDTPKGKGYCIAWIDGGPETDTLWKVMLDASGQVWDFPQSQVRGRANFTMGRTTPEKLSA